MDEAVNRPAECEAEKQEDDSPMPGVAAAISPTSHVSKSQAKTWRYHRN
jgi:hypothetical protein